MTARAGSRAVLNSTSSGTRINRRDDRVKLYPLGNAPTLSKQKWKKMEREILSFRCPKRISFSRLFHLVGGNRFPPDKQNAIGIGSDARTPLEHCLNLAQFPELASKASNDNPETREISPFDKRGGGREGGGGGGGGKPLAFFKARFARSALGRSIFSSCVICLKSDSRVLDCGLA